ncbi:MAG: ECF transporter S component [Defluviitaleaceae bacterium]|nr:ECF transporter S component [Defluviitaleaceae bacterium]
MQPKHKLLNTRTMIILAMISAIAFLLAAFVRFPVFPAVPFLRYDPKDIVIVIGGFIFGPLAALIVTVVVALVQMFTTSQTGLIGFFMNVVSGAAFACTAALIYQRWRTLSGAVVGLVAGTIAMTIAMVLWNYILTPIFLGWPREAVVAILVPGIIPFNVFNGVVNGALVMLAYKPVTKGLQAAGLLAAPPKNDGEKRMVFSPALIAISIFVLLSMVFWYLATQGFFQAT